ncbi:hypothetical protein N657DRAFT_682622 [Parathielavia appendiculata]|uniref:Uncharacterized protein n=1 Tax=Parathielavia appendiculata TaxID=2587402 RepID=A0AAN6TWL7_9PEZI|nr:hypothetical protein N657DRAFT_682622 [Parathielavia appendiculata]
MAAPETSTSDGTIAAVAKLVLSDIFYGETQDLRVHVNGVRNMVSLRGELDSLGIELVKMVLLADLLTAVTLEVAPSFSYPELVLHESTTSSLNHTRFGFDHPTPAVPPSPRTKLHSSTTAMLKDIDFLIDTVLALPSRPSPWDLQKVQSMSAWVHGRLLSLEATTIVTTDTCKDPTSSSSSSTDMNLLHRAVRLASLAYCRAIQSRRCFSQGVQQGHVVELAEAVGNVPLETWEGASLKTLLLLLAVALPTARDMDMQECCTLRTMMVAAAVQIALTDWSVVARTMSRVVELQAWLRGCLD